MKQINVTSDPLQRQSVILPNGQALNLTVYYRPIQQGWFLNQVSYSSVLVLNTLRITNQVNMLRQWKNLVPFGIGCFSTGNREPTLVQDFSSGQSRLMLLDEAEVEFYEQLLTQGG